MFSAHDLITMISISIDLSLSQDVRTLDIRSRILLSSAMYLYGQCHYGENRDIMTHTSAGYHHRSYRAGYINIDFSLVRFGV